MSSTGVQLNDGRVQNRIENYSKFWQKDPNKEQDIHNKSRLNSYTEVVNGNYLSTHGSRFFVHRRQVITTVQPNYTSMVGPSRSTFLALRREKHSWLL